MLKFAIPAVFALMISPALAEQGCKYDTDTNVVAYTSLIGADNCEAFCRETEGCIGWWFTPHNKSPDTVNGRCMAFDKIGEKQISEKHFCGTVDE